MTRMLALCVAACSLTRPAPAQEDAAALQALIQKVAPAIVTVKAVIRTEYKMGGQSENQESRLTVQGVVVDPEGLVVISNFAMSPGRAMEMMGMGEMFKSVNMKVTPVSFKLTFEREEQEYDAFLAATDTKLDLAFLKIENLGDRKPSAIDFGAATEAVIGQAVAGITRLDKGYDFAPFFQTGRVCGEIARPRKAWILDGGISGLGLPVFTLSGEVLGVLTTIPSGLKAETGDDSMGFTMFIRMFTGGGGTGAPGAFVLPGAALKPLIEQAKVRAVEVAAERARKKEQPAAAPAKKPAPAAPKKPAPKP